MGHSSAAKSTTHSIQRKTILLKISSGSR